MAKLNNIIPAKIVSLFFKKKANDEISKKQNSIGVNSLAPKIIIDLAELIKVNPYLDSLKLALETNHVNNIAITGGYGSGKSTILKTFQHHHPEYVYLNISLASFTDNKEDKDDFERKLEVSILQHVNLQLKVYH